MPQRFRELRVLLLLLLASGLPLRAQDMPVRVEAVRLLERANAVSRPAHLMPSHKHEITFRAYGLDGTTREGSFNVLASGDIERYEIRFENYHAISIHFPDKIVQNEYQPPPQETMEADQLTPVLLGRFDKSDTIQAITAATLFGRSAKCIQFET